jgi:hypothetical protein
MNSSCIVTACNVPLCAESTIDRSTIALGCTKVRGVEEKHGVQVVNFEYGSKDINRPFLFQYQ